LSSRGRGFGGVAASIFAALIVLSVAVPDARAKESWDHVANIKDAAKRLAVLHEREGSVGVLKFLDACYRTQMLASEYSQGLESCMAQDYMHTRVLAKIYAAIPEDERAKMGVPSPEAIADGMGKRFVAAFSQYKISTKQAEAFKKMVDKNGLPLFVKSVFPKEKAGESGDGGQ
jgi:hypothetical protein